MKEENLLLGDIVQPRNEKVIPSEFPELPFIGLEDIEAHSMRLLSVKSSTKLKSSAKRFYQSDVLYSRLRPYLNKVWKADRDGICSSEFIVLPGNKNVDAKFLALRLNASDFVRFANSLNAGDRPRVDFNQISSFFFPPFSLSHQRSVVARIEELFSELDNGIESLKTAKEQLKVYRQALLKHAFEGKLTEQWRKDNADKLETAEQLLDRIQQEREACYQQQLKEWKTAVKQWEAKGKEGKKPRKPLKDQESPSVSNEETDDLPSLPKGWKWVRPQDVSSYEPYSIGIGPFGSNLKVSDYTESGVPLIFVRNITRNNFTDDLKYISVQKYKTLLPHAVKPLDILVTKMGDPPGDAEIYPEDQPVAVLTADCLKFRVWDKFASREYFKYCINSVLIKKQLGLITKGVAQKKISAGRFKTLLFPLPPKHEQEEIASRLEANLTEINRLEGELDDNLKRVDTLRQSILKKAFSGQLVAQDANDEPATLLLERIAAEKAQAVANSTRRKTPGRKPRHQQATADVLPFKTRLNGISTTDLHAGILALAHQRYEDSEKAIQNFGHVKGEKIAHLVEAYLGIDLDRQPVKDAAGPNDYPHLMKVESRARKAGFFDVKRVGSRYTLRKGRQFDGIIDKCKQALGPRLTDVEALLLLLKPLNTRQAEIVATLYAAWNNLLLDGIQPDDEAIVTEARENWHKDKLNIERDKFFRGLEWMRKKGLVPQGQGEKVVARNVKRTGKA